MEDIQEKLRAVVKRIFDVEVAVELTLAPEGLEADYATNIAMQLARTVHQNPMVIAEQLREGLSGEITGMEVTVAAPGFLNFRLDDEHFAEKVAEIANGEVGSDLGQLYAGQTVVTEFSDPNPFKVLHVGHLYTSVVGDSIARLFGLAGAKVVRTNFGGDVGLHVAKTIWALRSQGVDVADLTIEQIGACYVEGTRAYDDDPEAEDAITTLNKVIYALSGLGEERSTERLELESVAEDYELSTTEVAQVAQLYWAGRRLSYAYFDDFYRRIGVKFDKYYPESTVADRGLTEVKAHLGSTYEESDGAVVYRGEKVGLHTRVFINKEGVPTYEAKDVGLIFTKWDDWQFAKSVVITGNEQSDYMKVVLASVQEYAPELVERTRHLTHGMVRLPGNQKMSSRKGNFLKAVDILELVREELGGEGVDERLVLAAIKYAFLRYKMGGDIIFDVKESVSTTGNSGIYLLYAVVRAKKILQKIGKLSTKITQQTGVNEEKYVRKLNTKIVQYGEIWREAVQEMAPYKLCAYLYELAQEFSRFYEHVPVAGSAEEEARGQTVQAYLKVMEQGLGLLGIDIPEEM